MPRAIWNDVVIAKSDATVIVEGNHYFPEDEVNRAHLRASTNQTVCPWKGTASYYDLVVDGELNPAAASYYPEPKEAAKEIAGHLAFWKGIVVED